MSVEWSRIQQAAFDHTNGRPHALEINSGITFVRVDHIKTAPVPKLHVDLPWAVLMVTGNDESTAFAGEFSRNIERPLLADCFNDYVAKLTIRQAIHFVDDARVIVHL